MVLRRSKQDKELHREFVTTCYRWILGREPDDSGMKAHLSSLNGPKDYSRLIRAFCESAEFKARVLMKRPDLGSAKEKYYFVHIHKTGGTTIHDWLLYKAAPGRVFPGFFVNDLIKNVKTLKKLDIFTGHFSNTLDFLLGCKTRKATLLRDPGDRMISRYHHVMRNQKHALHAIFKERSLEEATASQRHRQLIGENYQAKRIAQVVSTEDEPLTSRQLDLLGEDELYERARAALDEFELVGVLDYIDEFACELASLWGLPRPDGLIPKNVNPRGSVYDPALRNKIREMNAVDNRLYREVRERWADRVGRT